MKIDTKTVTDAHGKTQEITSVRNIPANAFMAYLEKVNAEKAELAEQPAKGNNQVLFRHSGRSSVVAYVRARGNGSVVFTNTPSVEL